MPAAALNRVPIRVAEASGPRLGVGRLGNVEVGRSEAGNRRSPRAAKEASEGRARRQPSVVRSSFLPLRESAHNVTPTRACNCRMWAGSESV